ncbi:mCG1039146, partial [Mus musculus]
RIWQWRFGMTLREPSEPSVRAVYPQVTRIRSLQQLCQSSTMPFISLYQKILGEEIQLTPDAQTVSE